MKQLLIIIALLLVLTAGFIYGIKGEHDATNCSSQFKPFNYSLTVKN